MNRYVFESRSKTKARRRLSGRKASGFRAGWNKSGWVALAPWPGSQTAFIRRMEPSERLTNHAVKQAG